MAGRIVQGFFVGGGAQRAAMTSLEPRSAGPANLRLAPPAPPAMAFAGCAPAAQLRPASAVVQRHGGDDSFAIDPAKVGLGQGRGAPLSASVRTKMEAAFGADFSGVRVHVGPQAARIGAIAFTTGNDIYFAPGQYQPDSLPGQQLLGHELAHVVQQRQGRVRAPASGVSVVQDRALEAEADRLGMRAASHRAPVQAKLAAGRGPLPRPSAPGLAVQRARSSRSRVDLTATDIHDIPNFDAMGLESVGGGGGGFDYFSGTGSIGERATAWAHGFGNMVTGQGRWANALWFFHGSKDSGRVRIRARVRQDGVYNPTGGTSATNYLSQSRSGHHQLRGLNAFGVSYHWNHLVASSLGGGNDPANIVSASKWANGEMLAIEGTLSSLCLKNYIIDVRVQATLAWGSDHQAENITYQVFGSAGPLLFTRNIDARRAIPLTKSERDSIADEVETAVIDYDKYGTTLLDRQLDQIR